MFKKITAVIVATTMMVVGLTAMPANATVTSNAGAVSKTNWSLKYLRELLGRPRHRCGLE
ncbi:MAG: hypothetical protein RL166_749 [Actinomycetota bacterium]